MSVCFECGAVIDGPRVADTTLGVEIHLGCLYEYAVWLKEGEKRP